MRRIRDLLLAASLVVGSTVGAHATTIAYDVAHLGGGRWEYSYEVTNDTLSSPIEELAVYFEQGLYENLEATGPFVDWDPITDEPGLVLGFPVDGFCDAMALAGGIAPGDTASGFSVSMSTDANIYIGKSVYYVSAGRAIYWNGVLDELKIYNTVLDTAEILAQFEETTPVQGSINGIALNFEDGNSKLPDG